MDPIKPEIFSNPPLNRCRLFDTHCHVTADAFSKDQQLVLKRAADFGIERLVVIGAGTKLESNERTIALAQQHATKQTPQYPMINYSIGIHPHDADIWNAATKKSLHEMLSNNHAVAIGEIGLDYHYNFATKENQWHAFTDQLELAEEFSLPFIVHTREADDDTYKMLKNFAPLIQQCGGVMHCFSGTPQIAEKYLQLGMHLSFSGIVTFPKAHDIQQSAIITPPHRLLIETDAPYLTPHPHRGRRNEPACLYWTALKVAELRKTDFALLTEQTFNNACRFFKIT
jgi:TatD DNase family protein